MLASAGPTGNDPSLYQPTGRTQPHIHDARAYTVIRPWLWHPLDHKHTTPLSEKQSPPVHTPAGFFYAAFPSTTEKTYTITEEYFATHTKEDLDRVTKYSNRQDKGAVMEMAAQGRVFATVPGMRVYLVKSAGVLGSMVKLRQVGKTREFWTVREAIQ